MKITKRELLDTVYLLGYTCILIAFMLGVSQAPNQYVFLYSVMRYLRVIGYACCFIRVALQGKLSMKHIMLIATVLLFVFISTITTDSITILNDIVVLAACKGISVDQIIRIDFKAKVVYGIITVLLLYAGVVSDVLEYRNGVLSRHSWGFAHPNRFALHVFAICIYLIYLKRNRIKWTYIFIVLFLGIVTLNVTDGRTGFVGIVLTLALAIVLKVTQRNKRKQIKLLEKSATLIGYASFFGSILVSFLIPVLYIHGRIRFDITSTIASRFSLSAKALTNYGIRAFGQHIDFITTGVARILGLEANGIDNMYVYLGVYYGAIVMVLILWLSFCGIRYSIKNQDYVGTICFSIVSVMGVLENQFLNIESNAFLFFIGYYWYDTYKNRREKSFDQLKLV